MAETTAQFTLDNFRTLVRNQNLARSNRFEVIIFNPAVITSLNTTQGDANRNSSLLAEDVIFPGLMLGTRALRINNANHQRATFIDHGGDSITITFLCDNAWTAKYFFGTWMRNTVNPNTREIAYPENYYGSLEIYALNEQDQRMAGWVLEDVFPRSIAPVQASGTNAQALRMPVTFSYLKWKVIPVNPNFTDEGSEDQAQPVEWTDSESPDDPPEELMNDPEIAVLQTEVDQA